MKTRRSPSKLRQMMRVLRESAFLLPSSNLKSILGEWKGLRPPYHPWSEYNIFKVSDWSSFKRLLSFVADSTLLWYKAPKPTDTNRVETILLPSDMTSRFAKVEKRLRSESPSSFVSKNGTVFPGEAWFYINGILTDETIATMNGEYIAHLFGRKVEVLHNPTDALLLDLVETVVGRTWQSFSRADQFAYDKILSRLKDESIKKVVILAHSQGTVLMANVLRKLQELHPALVRKLEIYTIANCASSMKAITDEKGLSFPYMEHFANTKDLICRLGVLATKAKNRGEVQIDGPVFVKEGWGHLLNVHYLTGIQHHEYVDAELQKKPRIYEYLEGHSPSA